MNFEKIPPVPGRKLLIETAFKRARERASEKKLAGKGLQLYQRKEALKGDIVRDAIIGNLDKVIRSFPNFDQLPAFYRKLVDLTLDYPFLKKSLGALNWAKDRISLLHKEYQRKLPKTRDVEWLRKHTAEFYGRTSSMLKQIDPQLQYLERCRQVMKTYPDIKDMFTICIYGFPNVGKTTLMNTLAKTKAKVAAYAFTTKSINSGYLEVDGKTIQVLDVPGTLARPEKMNPIELQAELVLEELADVVIFVFDLSGYSGYGIEKQEQLFKKVKKNKNVLVYVSKLDLTDPEELKEFKHKYYLLEEIKPKLKQKIQELAPEVEASSEM